jgi:hypothetical protein
MEFLEVSPKVKELTFLEKIIKNFGDFWNCRKIIMGDHYDF